MNDTLLVLPTLNEEEALSRLAGGIPPEIDVLVVDSLSTDRTCEIARKAGFDCINVKYGRGQGSGIRTGMEHFLEKGYKVMLLMDADYTDDPGDLPKVASTLEGGGFDIVVGVRDLRKQREYLGLTTILVKKTVSLLIFLLMGLRLRDMLTGVWAFDRDAVEAISPRLRETGFEYGFEIVYNAWLAGLKIGEADVGFRRRLGTTKLTFKERFIQVFYGIKYGLWIVRLRLAGRAG
jgi:dolichol-phosphate mannosyltransferase